MPKDIHIMGEMMHKAISSGVRRELLLSLADGEKYLSELAEVVKRKPQTVDFHLNILSELGLVGTEWKEGKRFYFIKDKKIAAHLKDKHTIEHKPPHEIVADSMQELTTTLQRIEKKLDKLLDRGKH